MLNAISLLDCDNGFRRPTPHGLSVRQFARSSRRRSADNVKMCMQRMIIGFCAETVCATRNSQLLAHVTPSSSIRYSARILPAMSWLPTQSLQKSQGFAYNGMPAASFLLCKSHDVLSTGWHRQGEQGEQSYEAMATFRRMSQLKSSTRPLYQCQPQSVLCCARTVLLAQC